MITFSWENIREPEHYFEKLIRGKKSSIYPALSLRGIFKDNRIIDEGIFFIEGMTE